MVHARRNIKSGVILKVITPLTSFVTRTALIYSLGNVYLGLNGLFTSMLQVLSLAELGFGSAMVFSMYKPIAQGDETTVNALLALYRRIYRIVGAVILGVGAALIPFLPRLIHGDVPAGLNLTVLYLIRLADTSVSYFLFSYRNCLLDASQRRSVVQTIQSLSKVALCVVQVTLLLLFKNYYVFCVVIPCIQVCQNIAYWVVSQKMFPQYRCDGKLPPEAIRDITKRVTGLFMFRLSHVLRNSFDSIILSAFLGLDILAKYQNYFLIVTTVVGISSIVTDSTLSSIVKYPFPATEAVKQKFGYFTQEKEIYDRIATELGLGRRGEGWFRHPLAYLVEAADDICYEIMDIEDAHKLKILSFEETRDLMLGFLTEERRAHIIERSQGVDDKNENVVFFRSCAIGELEKECVRVFVENEEAILNGTFEGSLIDHACPLVHDAFTACVKVAKSRIYRSRDVVDTELAGYKIIYTLIQLFTNAVMNPHHAYSSLLLDRVSSQYEVDSPDTYVRIMAVLDYLSGMTDVFALDLYRKINGESLPMI